MLAAELRGGVVTGVRSIVQAPSMRVPHVIWAGVIQVFLAIAQFLESVVTLGSSVAFTAILAGGGGSLMGGSAHAERMVLWAAFGALLSLARFSTQLPLIYGLFARKRWAYGLYFWTLVPFALGGIVLGLSKPGDSDSETAPLAVSFVAMLVFLVSVALLVGQAVLVWKGKDELTES
jgi:hypothetical protein